MVKLNRKIEEEKPNYLVATISIVAIFLIIIISVFGIFKLSDKEKLYGTWNLVSIEENKKKEDIKYNYQITFFEDNTLTVTDNKKSKGKNEVTNYKYKIDKDVLIITLDDKDAEIDLTGRYSYKVSGKKLKLIKDDKTMNFKVNKGY